MKSLARLAIPAAIAAFGVGAHAATNVALGAGVTAAGTVYGAPLSTVTDGTFLPEFTTWTDGTVYWNGVDASLTIDLGGTFTLKQALVQADDNDSYRLQYWDGANWQTAWDVPNYDFYKVERWGMTTRPEPEDRSVLHSFATAITTDKLRFTATGGDNFYSVSEIQVFAVPEPETYAMMLAGLGLIGAAARRKRA